MASSIFGASTVDLRTGQNIDSNTFNTLLDNSNCPATPAALIAAANTAKEVLPNVSLINARLTYQSIPSFLDLLAANIYTPLLLISTGILIILALVGVIPWSTFFVIFVVIFVLVYMMSINMRQSIRRNLQNGLADNYAAALAEYADGEPDAWKAIIDKYNEVIANATIKCPPAPEPEPEPPAPTPPGPLGAGNTGGWNSSNCPVINPAYSNTVVGNPTTNNNNNTTTVNALTNACTMNNGLCRTTVRTNLANVAPVTPNWLSPVQTTVVANNTPYLGTAQPTATVVREGLSPCPAPISLVTATTTARC